MLPYFPSFIRYCGEINAEFKMEGMKKMEKSELQLQALGNQGVPYLFDYTPDVLETFDNKHPGRDYFVKFNCPEFTSLCPITNQPDFATIYISYIPHVKM